MHGHTHSDIQMQWLYISWGSIVSECSGMVVHGVGGMGSERAGSVVGSMVWVAWVVNVLAVGGGGQSTTIIISFKY